MEPGPPAPHIPTTLMTGPREMIPERGQRTHLHPHPCNAGPRKRSQKEPAAPPPIPAPVHLLRPQSAPPPGAHNGAIAHLSPRRPGPALPGARRRPPSLSSRTPWGQVAGLGLDPERTTPSGPRAAHGASPWPRLPRAPTQGRPAAAHARQAARTGSPEGQAPPAGVRFFLSYCLYRARRTLQKSDEPPQSCDAVCPTRDGFGALGDLPPQISHYLRGLCDYKMVPRTGLHVEFVSALFYSMFPPV